MTSSKNYFGLGPVEAKAQAAEKDGSLGGLPASWYTSVEMYELERRAIFSKKWLLTTHSLRFDKTGDWIRYNIAGFPFVLVKDREGQINAFHNVCRHRAFPIVTEDQGTSRIFSCKYHGWSYGLNGKLAKAPGYQDLDGFDKSKNNLFPIHVHVDDNGFIWVNLDGGETPAIAWDDDFAEITRDDRFSNVNWEDYQFDHTWEVEGAFNWKILADSYDESTSPSDVLSSAAPTSSSPEQIDAGIKSASTYYFPNASITNSPQAFFMKRFVPTSPTTCTMRYEVYRNKDTSDEDFELINLAYKRIMFEEKDVCLSTQQQLNDELPPNTEKGSLYFQMVVRDLVQEHFNTEKVTGQAVWPARQTLPPAASTSQEDVDFCSQLEARDCSTLANDGTGCCGGTGCQQPAEALAF